MSPNQTTDQTTILILTQPHGFGQVRVLASEIVAVETYLSFGKAQGTNVHLRSGGKLMVAEDAEMVSELWMLHIESTWGRSSEIQA